MAARRVFCLLLYKEGGVSVEEFLNAIVTFIRDLGFPIACVCVLFWMLDRERQEHKNEADRWAEAINNNTRVMERLIDRLDGKDD